ncbi:hypothetical protein RJ640_024570 [Escallonia rubra]|uniref:Uncharacterized protein n=1 Tax=Escallonia rubra TaxID=112253 RepID=A0AA88UMV4_9ASTE|nr:hypothetical protein RJ640_024570 [Escallonia rubra]
MVADFIKEIDYPEWIANVVMVPKAGTNKWRICIDYTDLNRACPKDSYPLPRIDTLIDATSGHQLLSFMDAFSGYNQIRMHADDVAKTAFITDQGLFCYNVMPFGLKNAGATYQRLVDKIFKPLIRKGMEVYVDDMLVKSLQAEDHIADLRQCFTLLREYRMRLNPTKCAFGVSSGKFLGFMISERGIEANPEKIQAIQEMVAPRRVKEIQILTGRIAALSRFLSKSAERCLPFFKALKNIKNFEWTDECQTSFDKLKEYLTSPPLLSKPLPGEDLFLYLAVSESAVSAVLIREQDGRQLPIYYVSKILQGAEQRYPNTEKLAFALLIAARSFSHTMVVLTDKPLSRILHKPDLSGRLVPWSIELGKFDIHYRPRPSVKGQALADFVVECTFPIEDEEPLLVQPELFAWTLFIDGSSNTHGSGAGLILNGPEGLIIEYALHFDFQASNNEAEYEALIAGMHLAHAMRAASLHAFSDSALVVKQMSGEYEAKDPKMVTYLSKAKEVARTFTLFKITQIRREDNTSADALSRLASLDPSGFGRTIHLELLHEPSIATREVMQTEHEPSWIDPIKAYLQDDTLPADRKQARSIILRLARYDVVDDVLYKRSFTLPYLRCLTPIEANYAMREVHEGICGQHLGGRALAHKKQKPWPRLLKKKCEDFFWRAIVYRFGIPRVLVTDNGKQFDNSTFRSFCTNLSIEQRFTSVAHPQTNGQTKVTNRTLLQGIKKRLDGAKSLWVEELPKILWAYNTTTRTPTGETPFSLSFGTEALIPMEVGLPSLRLTSYDPIQNEEALRANLDLLDERREQAAMHHTAYQHRVSRFYDQRVRPRAFRVGDLVLRRIEASAPHEAIGKLAPNWEDPYRVVKLGSPGAYHLEQLDGKAIPRTWNAIHLRRYYP